MDERTKKILEDEKDPRILRALVGQILEDNARLRGVIAQIEKEKSEKDQAAFNLEERVKLLRRSMFGPSRESRPEASDRSRDKSQVEALLFSQAAFPATDVRDDAGHGKSKGQSLEPVVIDHLPPSQELLEESRLRGVTAPEPSDWTDTGLYDESIKIQIIERRYVKEIHRKHKFKLRSEVNPDPDKEVIITASGGAELLPGMSYTTEFVVSVVSDKYISHMPLERQTREMESLGLIGMKTSTLSRMSALAAASLEPLAEAIKKELIRTDIALHVDETPWKIQKKDEKDGYMWVMANRFGSYYFYRPTRSGQVLREILADRDGPILTDGYSGYNILEEIGIKQAYCWAHARREFLPLEDHDPTVRPILDDIDELFAIDREAKTFGELEGLRLIRSTVVTARLREKLNAEYPNARTGSQKRKAIEYVLKRWIGFTLFIRDTRIPLSNNEAERTIRHAVMGRKNYYGSGNHSGAETAATLFTIIESAKKNDIDPRSFLLMTLDRVARGQDLETPLDFARRTRQPA